MLAVAPSATAGDITFTKDVAPILNENCVTCHRAGEAVPFTLTSYEEIRPWAKSIRKMVDSRLMPPWHADAAIGKWKNDRRLSEEDINTIVAWIDQGARRGDPNDLPPALTFEEGWKIGEPDAVFSIPEQVLPADLEDEYRYVPIPTGFKEDRWIQSVETRPGNMEVVHHVIIFTASPQALVGGGGDGFGSGLGGGLGGFAPGSSVMKMSEGQGLKIPAGSLLVLQIHYHKEPGTIERDITTVGLKFADYEVKKEFRFGAIGNEGFRIPAGAEYYSVDANFVVQEDIHLEQIVPHMHLRGKDMHVWAKYPDGRTEDILWVPNYDFNWQTFYEFETPLMIPEGTELFAKAHFDNSENNPFNPDPTKDVTFGLPTTDEMMFAFYMYTADNEELSEFDPSIVKNTDSKE